MRTFGEALLELIEASHHRNQRQFALAIGMEPTYMNRIVKGTVKRPDPETLQKMAAALALDYGELLALAGYPPLEGVGDNGDGSPSPRPVPDDDDLDPARCIATLLAFPDAAFVAQVEATRLRLPTAAFDEWAVSVCRAWRSNGQLALSALRLGGR